MYFNNPSVLFASLLVIIPVILHFLNLNKVKKIEFSSLMFLKEVKEKKIRKLKIQYLYLMIIRILLIILIVLTFSNPVIKSDLFENYSPNNSVVLIDNSPSSEVTNPESLNKIKNIIKDISGISQSSGNLNIYTTDALVYGNNQGINFNSSDLSFNPGRNLVSLIKYMKTNDDNKENELFILSGFHRSDYQDLPVFNNYYKNYNLSLINLYEKNQTNLSIKSISLINSIPDINSSQRIEVEVYNHNNFDVYNKRIVLYLKDEKYFEKISDIQAMNGVKILFDIPPEKQFHISGFVELIQDKISDDEITFDNRKYFSINYPEIINLLLVGDSKNNFEFIEKALRMTYESNKENSLFSVNYNTSLNINLNDFNLIIISGKRNLSNDEIKNLHDYMMQGRGLIIFPGRNIEIESYNSFLKEYSGLLKIQGIEKAEKTEDKLVISNTNDFLLSGIFEKSINGKSEYSEAIKIQDILKVLNNNQVSQIIENSEKKGILYKIPANRKGILLFSIASDYSMSDFPSKSIFLPLLYRSIFYSSNSISNYNFIVGNPGIVNLVNKSYIIPVDSNFKKSGNYKFNGKGISFNIDELESDLTVADKNEIIDFYKKIGFNDVKYYENAKQFKSGRVKSTNSVNLFYFLLTAMFFILLAEMFYSRKIMNKLKIVNKYLY